MFDGNESHPHARRVWPPKSSHRCAGSAGYVSPSPVKLAMTGRSLEHKFDFMPLLCAAASSVIGHSGGKRFHPENASS